MVGRSILYPDSTLQQQSSAITTSGDLTLDQNWQDINNYSTVIKFTNAQIIEYFVLRTAIDGLPVSDFKSMNTSALNLYKCGHIQKVEACICSQFSIIYLRAVCLPEMGKERVYLLEKQLDSTNFEIQGASCGYPAERGPKTSCKHVAALCYALDDYSKLQSLPDLESVTECLQTWNQPKPKKLNPLPVINLRTRKEELLPPTKHSLDHCRSHFDPRPAKYRKIDGENV